MPQTPFEQPCSALTHVSSSECSKSKKSKVQILQEMGGVYFETKLQLV